MTLRFDRGMPPFVALALLGGLLAAGALLLPWFVMDEQAARTLVQSMAQLIGGDQVQPGGEVSRALDAGVPAMLAEINKELVGIKVFSVVSVGLHAAAAGVGVFAALKAWSGQTTVEQQRAELLGAAGLVAVRPIIALLRDPGSAGLSELPGFTPPDGLFHPGIGIWVALGGAALFAVAGLLASRGESAAAPAEWTSPVAAPTGAFVPGAPAAAQAGFAPAAPQAPAYAAPPAPAAYAAPPAAAAYAAPPAPAYAPPPAAHAPAAYATAPGQPHVPAPSGYQPGSAYGDSGPGTLDRDSRLVRPNDPYAPKPMAAPAVPMKPAPAAIMPVNDPSPVADAPGAIYGVPPRPAPQAPQAPPTRTGSTAPPGLA